MLFIGQMHCLQPYTSITALLAEQNQSREALGSSLNGNYNKKPQRMPHVWRIGQQPVRINDNEDSVFYPHSWKQHLRLQLLSSLDN
ncbi:hypothetical protein RB195_018286 [Necator americanus]|uniref:Uncharacterized protein n=1 Tax=Necator americanus TaxID=51031 RepID=A0ABR1C904_NECAM